MPGDRQTDQADEEQEDVQEQDARTSRQTGGDAPAAGSIEQREAVAEDRDDAFDADEGDD